MLSGNTGVEWESASDGSSLSASQWYSTQQAFKAFIFLLETSFWIENNIITHHIQIKTDLRYFAEYSLRGSYQKASNTSNSAA